MLQDYMEKIYTGSQTEFYAAVDDMLQEERRRHIVTANPETLMLGQRNPALDRVLCASETIIVPDGIGIVKALRSLNKPTQGRIPGVELAAHLIEQCGRAGKRIYLYGAKQEIVQRLADQIRASHGAETVCGFRNGYGQDDDEVFAEIAALQPDLVLVALGIPRQELAIHDHLAQFQKGIFIGVGGSFDVLSGSKKRAPTLFIKFNLEWLYRILKEPKRLKRFYDSNIRFLGMVKKLKAKGS